MSTNSSRHNNAQTQLNEGLGRDADALDNPYGANDNDAQTGSSLTARSIDQCQPTSGGTGQSTYGNYTFQSSKENERLAGSLNGAAESDPDKDFMELKRELEEQLGPINNLSLEWINAFTQTKMEHP
ncbi:hypothetical protein I302_103990 [Kwoniella bestiolae CBS 10118]|uniref:Uncharacterized protein n=1 Tax=Kwoniella bestiolae CBS 10118 TaxID=1296100 RepID=A0A1B9G9Y2_9TREE|nr:hypothetical protein I302_02695 [Kwoniella bestiolae CBS 10118]OCF27845.1 hypothetical protein I302_02695 [Kwoniella bestiolae CBS 10118]